ncbi:MAG: PspC domain-containing protein [Proteobacteria bacterium]|nr:PspC domain-containing protein [Pseudomonadota bacterium]
MNTVRAPSDRRFYRDADRAVFGGVCAGLAGYFGLQLKVIRILAIVAFFMVMPVAVIAYLAAVFLIPAVSRRELKEFDVPRPTATAEEIRRRCREIDARLATLERHVTSSRFQLDQELSRL